MEICRRGDYGEEDIRLLEEEEEDRSRRRALRTETEEWEKKDMTLQ